VDNIFEVGTPVQTRQEIVHVSQFINPGKSFGPAIPEGTVGIVLSEVVFGNFYKVSFFDGVGERIVCAHDLQSLSTKKAVSHLTDFQRVNAVVELLR